MKKILILDDDPSIHDFLSLEFKGSDFQLDYASSTNDAIELLRDKLYFCCVLDIFMSDASTSDDIIKYLNSEEAGLNQFLPTILMSSRINQEKAFQLNIKGRSVCKTIVKPIIRGSLVSLIKGEIEPTVLLIDDDPDIQSFLKTKLLNNNATVFSCVSLHHAFNYIENTKLSSIIVDSKIGDEDTAVELLSFIQETPEFKSIPIYIMSSDSTPIDVEKFKDLNIKAIVKKPFKNGIKDFVGLEEEIQSFSSDPAQKEESQFVKGHSDDEDNYSQKISGSKDDLGEETIKIKGQLESEDKSVWEVKTLNNSKNEQTKEDQSDDINGRNKQGMTALMIKSFSGHEEDVKALLEEGADVNLKSLNGKTALHFAAKGGHPAIINLLIAKEAKVNERDNDKKEPLYDAIASRNPMAAIELIKLGARISTKYDGKTYLMLATMAESKEVVAVLMAKGQSPDMKDFNGHSAKDIARKKGNQGILAILESG